MPVTPIDEDDLYTRARDAVTEIGGTNLARPVRLQGGTSSITYSSSFDDSDGATRRVVLKVAPAGLAPTKNRDVLRQARLQRALQGTGVPCPAVVAEHAGAPPDIPPFYVMAFEEGDCVEPSLAGTQPLPPDQVRSRELDAARIVGTLHSLDPVALGLDDEPEVTPKEELDRWTQSLAACDEEITEGYGSIGDRLAAAVPSDGRCGLIHGDFRLGNTLSQGHGVVSVIDWEIWARSDPRVDLAWFLMMCNPDPVLGRPVANGMPSNGELLAAYQAARGGEVSGMSWFQALVRYKQAAISALIIRNARKRGESPPFQGPRSLLESARAVLDG